MSAINKLYESDLINSATPLETVYAGVHPRLYCRGEQIAVLRGRLSDPAYKPIYKPMFDRLARQAASAVARTGKPLTGDTRGVGCGLASLAAMYRLTGEHQYLDAATTTLHALCGQSAWGHSLVFGHWAHGAAVAYDWLYHDLDNISRQEIAKTLIDRANHVVRHWNSYGDFSPTAYACNHMGVIGAGLMSIGCATWGEIEGAGKVVRLMLEKLRLMSGALGEDGASAEGLAYGQYYMDFYLKGITLADELCAVDFFADNKFLINYPRFMIHASLGHDHWAPDATFMQFGDSSGHHWYGPDMHLRKLASRYRDGHAQSLANRISDAGLNGDSSSFLSLMWHDPTVQPAPIDRLEPHRHLVDKDIVLLRSDWSGSATVFGFKCGPNSGHRARGYRQNIAGGHMHPDAGHVLLHAQGDWLLIDDGYPKKMTQYQNTALVNGIGQTGEGGDWFEDLEMRRGKPEAYIASYKSQPGYDAITGNAAPSYEPAAGLTRFLRHVLYLRPDVWVLVDEFEAAAPSLFQQRFHGGAAFEPAADGAFAVKGKRAMLTLHPLGPTAIACGAFVEKVKGLNAAHPDHELPALAVSNTEESSRATFVTVLEVGSVTEGRARWKPRLTTSDKGLFLELSAGVAVGWKVQIHTGRPADSGAVFEVTR
jgi:hypothetical protein